MKSYTNKILTFAIVLLLLFSTACSNKAMKSTDNNEDQKAQGTEEDIEISIKGLKDGEKLISLKELKEIEAVTEEMESISSSGEVKKDKVKGVPLESILNLYNTSQKNHNGIRFIAGDNYSIVVPKEVLEKRKIVLAYEENDKPLDEKALPLMVAVPDERSMYWVKNLMGIELLEEEQSVNSKVVFLETVVSGMDKEDYTYYESLDKAVKIMDFLSKFPVETDKTSVFLKAADGLEKEEDIDVFKSGYIKTTGKDIPLFLSPDLPKGMHVKNILFFTYGDSTYFSINQGLKTFEKKVVEDNEGIPLKDIFKEVELVNGDKYLCTAEDGYEVEISADDISKGLIYPRDKDGFALIFEGMPKNTKIKGILSIEAVK